MIICPSCSAELAKTETAFICAKCGYNALLRNGIVYFNPEIRDHEDSYDSVALDMLLRVERKHFWFSARKSFIKYFMGRHVPAAADIIEIGAGTGDVAKMLLSCGYDVAVGELHRNGIEYARRAGLPRLYQFNLMTPPFRDHFDTACLFDVLEHLEDDVLAMKRVAGLIKNGGLVVATVPAFDWLWSREDTVGNHKRRYSAAELRELFESAGLEVLEAKYFFVSLLPLFMVRRIVRRDGGQEIVCKEAEIARSIRVMPGANGFLKFVMRIENFLQKYVDFPFGCSIAIAGRKRSGWCGSDIR